MTTSTTQAPARTGLVARHPFTSFVVLAFTLSWLVLSPWVLARNGLGVLPYRLEPKVVGLVLMLATFGPAIAALVVRRLSGERRERVHGARRGAAYLLVLVAIPVAEALGLVLLAGRGAAAYAVPAAVVRGVLGVLSGPLGEEPGWRGLAMPLLQRRMPPLPAALLLGLVWVAWHLPQFFTQEWDTPHHSASDVAGFLVFGLASAVLLAWAVNLAGGSLLVAVVGHTVLNAVPGVVNAVAHVSLGSIWPAALGLTVLAAIGAALTRGRLGWQPGRDGGSGLR